MDIAPDLGENEGVLRRLLVLTSLVLACGPDAAATAAATTVAEGSTATSDTATSDTATSGPPTSTADATTGTVTTGMVTTGMVTTEPVTTEPVTTSDASTGDTSTTSSTGSSTGDSSTGEDGVEYAAYFWAGGLDHIMVHRADLLSDRCTTIHFAWPGGADPAFNISAPNEWAVVNADVSMGSADCLAGMPMGVSEGATGGQGTATWRQDPNLYCPLTIDLDLVLDFPQVLPWVPAQEHMLVTALPVQNCP